MCWNEDVKFCIQKVQRGIMHERTTQAYNRYIDEFGFLFCVGRIAPQHMKDIEANDEESPAWSLPTLVRLYLEKHVIGEQEMNGVIGALIGDDELPAASSTKYKGHDWEPEIVETDTVNDTERAESEEKKVIIALCALYFNQQHTNQGVTRAVTKASKISNLEDSPINDLRRKAIEPLIWLLDKPEEGKEWTAAHKCWVRKILLDYICRRQLDSENIAYLLKLAACPSAQSATLRAITNITIIEETPLLNKNTVGFVSVVLDIMNLEEGFHTSLQEAASAALRGICFKALTDKTEILITSMSGVLDVLVHSLAIPVWKSEAFALNAAHAIRTLACSNEEENHRIILGRTGLLPGLVNSLSKHDNSKLQTAAAKALANLAWSMDEAIKLTIANEQGALAGLVSCLSKQDNSELQMVAAGALANLVRSMDESINLTITNKQGALAGLVSCLSKHDNNKLQTEAAGALANLASSMDESIKLTIMNEQGALAGLVNCLSKQDNSELQTAAAWALQNLAFSMDESLKLSIGNEQGALAGLVNCLSKHDNSEVQTAAAKALANLASSIDPSIKLTIGNEQGALAGLVNCLSKHDNSELQTAAARALANLARSIDVSLKWRIINEKGALVGLVNCLSRCEDPDLQRKAAFVALNLARAPDARRILKGSKGLLQGLTRLVRDDVRRDVRNSAVEALLRIDRTIAKDEGLLSVQLDACDANVVMARIFVKAKFGDLQGALDDANEAIAMMDDRRVFFFQERGVLKQMMGDNEGALADLDEGLKLDTSDYDLLKHRGHVKFLLHDIEGARTDAKWALSNQSSRLDIDDYLGATPVKYLGYEL